MKYALSLLSSNFEKFLEGLCPVEVLVHPLRFSRYGTVGINQLPALAARLKKNGHRPVLCLDAMMREGESSAWQKLLETGGIGEFSAFRFVDPGVGTLVRDVMPDALLQQSLERSGMNSSTALHWEKQFGPERIILSPQLTLDNIRSFRAILSTELELLGIGPLEIFHSARPLLSADIEDSPSIASAVSMERPSSIRSRLVQTPAGTTMFYERCLFIQPLLEKIAEAGIQVLRYDFCDDQMWHSYLKGKGESAAFEQDAKAFGTTTRGFILANRTSAQFSRLVNQHAREAGTATAKVLQYVKPMHLMLQFFESANFPQTFRYIAPDGYETEAEILALTDLQGRTTTNATAGQVYSAPWVKKAITGTVLIKHTAVEPTSNDQ